MGYTYFTEEHEIFRKQVRDFAEKELAPHAEEWEEAGIFPRWVFERAGEMGLLGIRYPQEYGGTEADYWYTVVYAEEIVRCLSAGVVLALMVQSDMCTPALAKFGTEEQKQELLVPAISGKKIGAICVTEPGAGSDVAAIRTSAKKDGDYYIINGAKTFITNATRADWLTMAVKTDPDRGYDGMSVILFPTDTPGYTVTRKLNKLGHRSSDTAELSFEDCRVHKKYLLGEEGKGFYYIMEGFQYERLAGVITFFANAEYVLNQTIEYCKQREIFGKPIIKHQANAHLLVDLASEIEAARALIYHCADMLNRGESAVKEVSMCKLYAGELSVKVVERCLQLHGGYGYMEEYYVARAYRDIKLVTLGAGTSETMRYYLARLMEL